MDNNIKKLLEKAKSTSNSSDLTSLHKTLKEIKVLLLVSLLGKEVGDLSELLGTNKTPETNREVNEIPTKEVEAPTVKPMSLEETLEELKDLATTKTENEIVLFLLHRPTQGMEYKRSADELDFTTSEPTEWYAEVMSGELGQTEQNPVVSCWVPKANITGAADARANTGTWGDLGKNPAAESYSVMVKPGKYRIYQELKQQG